MAVMILALLALVFIVANAYYRDAALDRFFAGDTSDGYRGLAPPSRDVGWGYPAPPTRGVGRTLPGALFMYGQTRSEPWSYGCVPERTATDSPTE